MEETENSIGLSTLLEELKDLVLEMYCAIVKIKMEIAISGIKYDTNDLEKLEINFNNHLKAIEQSVHKNDFDNIDTIVQKFRNDLQMAKLIPINLSITAFHSHDRILSVISDFVGDTIEEIDKNLVDGMNNVSKVKH